MCAILCQGVIRCIFLRPRRKLYAVENPVLCPFVLNNKRASWRTSVHFPSFETEGVSTGELQRAILRAERKVYMPELSSVYSFVHRNLGVPMELSRGSPFVHDEKNTPG